MKTTNSIKLSVIAASLAFSSAAFSAIVNGDDVIIGWQSSSAEKFSSLDTSGNGLLLPLEAARGNAFNKKTFAKADADNDGTIDQEEYIKYETSIGVKDVPAATMSNETSSSGNMPANDVMAAVDQPEPIIQTAETTSESGEPNKRAVGEVIDDSVITTKAKAAIFNTPDLKTLDISVKTRQGEVVLTGSVASEAAKMKAEEVVRNVGGVNSVTNSLQVKK
jgi:hypothetical protein